MLPGQVTRSPPCQSVISGGTTLAEQCLDKPSGSGQRPVHAAHPPEPGGHWVPVTGRGPFPPHSTPVSCGRDHGRGSSESSERVSALRLPHGIRDVGEPPSPAHRGLKWLSVGEAWLTGRASGVTSLGPGESQISRAHSSESLSILWPTRPVFCLVPLTSDPTLSICPSSEDRRLSTSGSPGQCRARLLPLPLCTRNAAVG